MANSHPGSYCGQDAYNGMLITDENMVHRKWADASAMLKQGRCAELHARSTNNFEGGHNVDTIVRRLTPTECERLQGYPDGWTLIGDPEEVEVKDYEITYDEDGNETGKKIVGNHTEIEYFYTDENGKRKKVSDSARYKALGNSIATPFWFYLLRRISATYERPATLGSLFDGIGGFPYAWEKCNGEGTAVWASEIEEFPIAVTKARFPEREETE